MEYLPPKYKNINIPVYSTIRKKSKVLTVSHFHKSIEVIRVNDGEVECSIGTDKYRCTKGDIIFIPPYALHSIISLNENAEIQGVVFKASLVVDENSISLIDKVLNKDRIKEPIYRLGTEINKNIEKVFTDVVGVYGNDTFTYELDIKSAICKLLSIIIREYYADNNEMREYDRLIPVLNYIKNNYKEQIHTSELSAILNICDDHLIRLFKEVISVTPMKYINRVRLEEAQKLLINSDFSVTEISFMVGFSTVNYFSKIFTEVFGMTPSKYRKTNILPPKT